MYHTNPEDVVGPEDPCVRRRVRRLRTHWGLSDPYDVNDLAPEDAFGPVDSDPVSDGVRASVSAATRVWPLTHFGGPSSSGEKEPQSGTCSDAACAMGRMMFV